jgi:hypothetical protein
MFLVNKLHINTLISSLHRRPKLIKDSHISRSINRKNSSRRYQALTQIAVNIGKFKNWRTRFTAAFLAGHHCWAPLRGRSIKINGVGVVISKLKSHMVRNHITFPYPNKI